MRTKNELYQEALRTVAARRQIARARAEDARAEAEAAVPALRHAEEEVRVRGIRCALAGAAGKDRAAAAAAIGANTFAQFLIHYVRIVFQPHCVKIGD